MKTFKGGYHIPNKKEATRNKPIERAKIPSKVVLPLQQHIGAPIEPIVNVGDYVKTGQLIAKSDAPVSANLHASISGKIIAIEDHPVPAAKSGKCIVIEGDEKDDWIELKHKTEQEIEALTPDQILDAIRNAGIVGMGGAMFPTHIKLKPPKDKPIEYVILNGCECEPYLSCDHRTMLDHTTAVLKGLKLIMKAVNAKKAIIGIETNKKDAAQVLKKDIKELGWENYITVNVLKEKYPQGGEKTLIQAITGREVPPEGLPFEVGCIVSNCQTALKVCEAVYLGKPFVNRFITVSGIGIQNPKNLNVRLGTLAVELVEQCTGLKDIENIEEVVMSAPMMGISQESLDVPVTKGTSGITALPLQRSKELGHDKGKDEPYLECVKCSACVKACPLRLLPNELGKLVETKSYSQLEKYHVIDCVECGLCTYVCPSKRPLTEWIKKGKQWFITDRKKKQAMEKVREFQKQKMREDGKGNQH